MLCNVSPPTGFKSAFSSRQSVVANLQGIAAASSGSLNQAARTVPRVQQARLARSQIHRTASHQTSSQVFRYAIAHGLATRNPAADIKHSDVLGSRQKKNLARIEGKELPQLLRHIDAYHGAAVTRLAMKLMALTFVRTSELIGARWAEFDLKAERWDIPAERMKMKTPNIIPLSSQAVNILKTLHLISGRGALVFPGERDHEKPMSNNTILGALARMGYKGRMTGHGFRGIASTLLHEMRVIGYRVDVYEEVEAGRITADKAERLIAEQQAAWEAEGQAKERVLPRKLGGGSASRLRAPAGRASAGRGSKACNGPTATPKRRLPTTAALSVAALSNAQGDPLHVRVDRKSDADNLPLTWPNRRARAEAVRWRGRKKSGAAQSGSHTRSSTQGILPA
jgi:integrase